MDRLDRPTGEAVPWDKALIGSPAIRNRRNPRRINHLNFSNRHKTAFIWGAVARHRLSVTAARTHTAGQRTLEQPPKRLIGPPVIRIRRKPFRICDLTFSSRHKSRRSQRPRCQPRDHLISRGRPLVIVPMIFLIGPPVIRIRPKPFRIIGNSEPNRHKTTPMPIRLGNMKNRIRKGANPSQKASGSTTSRKWLPGLDSN